MYNSRFRVILGLVVFIVKGTPFIAKMVSDTQLPSR